MLFNLTFELRVSKAKIKTTFAGYDLNTRSKLLYLMVVLVDPHVENKPLICSTLPSVLLVKQLGADRGVQVRWRTVIP